MTLIQQDMPALVSNALEEKKINTDWIVQEYGNSFLESYDSFSVSKAISDQSNEHEGPDQMNSIEQLFTEEKQGEEVENNLQNMVYTN